MARKPNHMAQAWIAAAADLGILVEHPYAFIAQNGEQLTTVGVYLPDFGSPHGALLPCRYDKRHVHDADPATPYFRSYFGSGYEPYQCELFIEMLNDWGWFGAGEPPIWFRGGIGRHGGESDSLDS
jgi:hypothetical protein